MVVRFVESVGSGLHVAQLRGAAVAGQGPFLRFPNGLQAELPILSDGGTEVALLLPLDRDLSLRCAAARSLQQGLRGRWRSVPLPPRWRRPRLRWMLRTMDARVTGASWREIARVLFSRRFVGSTEWRDAAERGVAIRLAAAGRALSRGGYAVLLRRNALA